MLADPDYLVRYTAAFYLAKRGETAAVQVLLGALEKESYPRDPRAAQAIPGFGVERVLEVLVAAVRIGDMTAARLAVQALGKVPRSSTVLAALGRDRRELVRSEVATVLGELGDPASLPTLREMERDSSPTVQSAASDAIAKLGRH